MKEARRMLDHEDLSSRSRTRIPDQFMESELAKKNIQDHRHLKGDASLSPVRYQLPGRVEAYLSVVNFIAYEIMAAVMWKIDFHNMRMSYEDLVDKLSGISEVVLVRKGRQIYRWTAVSQEIQKLIKPFDIMSLQT